MKLEVENIYNMQHTFGISEYLIKFKNTQRSITYDTSQLINYNILFAGVSGSGKSYQLKEMLTRAAVFGLEVDVFDVHEELDTPESTQIKYSTSTKFGYNPLIVNPDIHSGGVRNSINSFITMLNATSSKLGSKQQSVIRSLLQDLYLKFDITDEDPDSWLLAPSKQPSIDDLVQYARDKLIAMKFGGDVVAACLNDLSRHASKIKAEQLSKNSSMDDKSFSRLKEKATEAFEDFVNSIANGDEIDEYLKYSNKEVLSSVIERITNLQASGIFNNNPPPHLRGSSIRCHQIKSLSDDEQILFVYSRLQHIFREARDRGLSSDINRVIVIDEAHKFFDDSSDNIINVIAKEGRKFGLALWCASQSPTHFTEDFLTNCSTIILLGIHMSYWDMACRKLKIKEEVLRYVKSGKIAAIQMQLKGKSDLTFQNVVLNSHISNYLQSKNEKDRETA